MFERINPDSEYRGTGIGLTIVRKAAERMGGRAGFESESGKGSKFWIELKKVEPHKESGA
jgi:signal transduction histidine kinase